MWNLNDAIRKAGSTTEVGVYDVGFAPHTDLVYAANITPLAVITDNPVLRTADAQAKAGCMTVRGTTTISGNKP